MPEVAGEIEEQVRHCLEYQGASSYVQMFGSKNYVEAIGMALVAGCRNRVMRSVRRDLELKASEMEMEDRTDAEVEA
jgi:hypothetical protein